MTDQDASILQASAVPYRQRNGCLEFCLITSSSKRRWGFPKGIIDPGETPRETALKEAEEEAGLHGRLEGDSLGQYVYRKWGTVLLVTVYLMRVTEADDDWEEDALRERVWHPPETARAALDRNELQVLLDEAVRRLADQAE